MVFKEPPAKPVSELVGKTMKWRDVDFKIVSVSDNNHWATGACGNKHRVRELSEVSIDELVDDFEEEEEEAQAPKRWTGFASRGGAGTGGWVVCLRRRARWGGGHLGVATKPQAGGWVGGFGRCPPDTNHRPQSKPLRQRYTYTHLVTVTFDEWHVRVTA